MRFEEFLEDKNVLMIPVYSTRSYKDGVYDLLADGNMSKFAMKILNCNAKHIDILYPGNSTGIDEIKKIICKYKNNVKFIPFKYGNNAHATRNMGKTFYNYIIRKGIKYDYIISEIDTLAEATITSHNELCNPDNFIYWAGSWNSYGTRWDDTERCGLNQMIAKNITTACLLKGQNDLYGGKSFYDICEYMPEYFDKKIIFFPFRLSDKSYHAEEFCKVIDELMQEGCDDFVVLYTDPNDSGIFDNKPNFYKVPKNKFVYQAILKGRPIIPYLDDVDKNYHSNIFEFAYYSCHVIMLKNKVDIFKYLKQINDISELKDELKILLGRYEDE